ncbi:MAG: glycosyltransferase [Gammaproteobacteria bacterium]|nr:glycosyltransferase [Gammaproteobacteria bacterium]
MFNTRFFELMATKTLILCPKSDSYLSLLKDGINCVMFNPNMSNFDEKLVKCIEDNNFRKTITENAYKNIEKHSYDARIATLLNYIEG